MNGDKTLLVIRGVAIACAVLLLVWLGFLTYKAQAPSEIPISQGAAGISTGSSSSNAPIAQQSLLAPSGLKNQTFQFPYTVGWTEGWSYVYNNIDWEDASTSFALTGVSIGTQESGETGHPAIYSIQLHFKVNNIINHEQSIECVPQNMRMVLDGQGDVEAPIEGSWQTPGHGCIEKATTYFDVPVTFPINATATHFLFTSGGKANYFFTVDLASDGTITVAPAVATTTGQ